MNRTDNDLYMLYLGSWSAVMSGARIGLSAGATLDSVLASTLGATGARESIIRSGDCEPMVPLSLGGFMEAYHLLLPDEA